MNGLPEGRPYHQLAVGGRWWRLPVGLVLFAFLALITVLVFIVAMLVEGYFLTGSLLEFGTGETIFADDRANLIAFIGTIAVLLPVVWLVTVIVDRRRIGTLSSIAGRLRWRWMAVSGLPAVGYVLAVWGLSELFLESDESAWIGWSAFLPVLGLVLLLVPFQAAAEEYMFRGWLMQAIGAFTRVSSPWPAIVLAAIPFVAGHGYTSWGLVDIGTFAVLVGWVAVKTGGLEAGIALHVVNNVVGIGAAGAEGDLSLEQGAVPLGDTIVDVGCLLAWAAVVVWLYTGRSRPMNRPS